MARAKRLVTEDPSAQIEQIKTEIEDLTQELKSKKATLKQLEKDKVAYDDYQEYLRQEKQKEEIVQMVMESGKSLDEIRELLFTN
nr:MAG TPA: V-type ATP synthase subunit I [Caudoviricetes sp.]